MIYNVLIITTQTYFAYFVEVFLIFLYFNADKKKYIIQFNVSIVLLLLYVLCVCPCRKFRRKN